MLRTLPYIALYITRRGITESSPELADVLYQYPAQVGMMLVMMVVMMLMMMMMMAGPEQAAGGAGNVPDAVPRAARDHGEQAHHLQPRGGDTVRQAAQTHHTQSGGQRSGGGQCGV